MCEFVVTYTVEANTQNKAIKTSFLNYLGLHAAQIWVKPDWYFILG
jgi:hypothetical protein